MTAAHCHGLASWHQDEEWSTTAPGKRSLISASTYVGLVWASATQTLPATQRAESPQHTLTHIPGIAQVLPSLRALFGGSGPSAGPRKVRGGSRELWVRGGGGGGVATPHPKPWDVHPVYSQSSVGMIISPLY